MNISSKISHWIFSLFLVLIFSIAATIIQYSIVQNQAAASESITISEHQYGQDGKPDGQSLDTEPINITEDYIYYNDRVLERYNYDSSTVIYTIEALNNVYNWIPDNISKYFMIAPMRIAIEENTQTSDREHSIKAINEINAELIDQVITIDLTDTLYAHNDEYIYFRTDKSWTSLGAYYAAKKFLSEKGTDIIPIENYYDEINNGYVGIMAHLDGAESLSQHPDLVYYYTLKGSSNVQSITAYDNKEYKEYTSPVIASSRGGTDVFIGQYYSHTIIQGDDLDAGSIIIIGEKHCKLLAPWLIPYYSKVILINLSFYNGDAGAIYKMIEEYDVNDFLIVECLSTIGESISSKRMITMFPVNEAREEE